jgi:hypothetical protein
MQLLSKLKAISKVALLRILVFSLETVDLSQGQGQWIEP